MPRTSRGKLVAVVALLCVAMAAAAQSKKPGRRVGQVIVSNPPAVPPTAPSNPSPADLATGIATTPTLSWTTGAGATCHDVRFGVGTPDPVPLVSSCQAGTTYSPAALTAGLSYSWQIVERNSFGFNTGPVWRFTVTTGGARTLLQFSNLTCDKVFLAPDMSQGPYTTTYPMALRVNGATRKYYELTGDNHIYEFAEPTGSACGTALASIAQAAVTTDWGTFPTVATVDSYIPVANSQTFVFGLSYDAASGCLFYNWTGTYSTIPAGSNSFACGTFGASSISLGGCWGLNARANTVGMPMGANGVLGIPSWFVSQYLSVGQTLAVGFGGVFATVGAKNSYGPSLEAIPVPAGNPCTTNTNTELSAGTVLMRYPSNAGPSCSADAGREVGCTPPETPGSPHPAQMAFASYSESQNVEDWEPYAGHGWWTETPGYAGWYDDGVKTGIVYSLFSSSGWMNTTVSASPAPTYVAGTITFTLPTIDMHDGNLQVGDVIWVTTCTVGVTPGCDMHGNMRDMSIATVTALNTGTRLVTADVTNGDFGTGDHKPVVGGRVFGGVIYAHGAPQPSRTRLLAQIYNPTTLANVTGGNTYDPVYAQEATLSSATGFVPYFGYPGGATPGVPFRPSEDYIPRPVGVGVDNTNHKIALMFRSQPNGSLRRNLVVVLSVN